MGRDTHYERTGPFECGPVVHIRLYPLISVHIGLYRFISGTYMDILAEAAAERKGPDSEIADRPVRRRHCRHSLAAVAQALGGERTGLIGCSRLAVAGTRPQGALPRPTRSGE